MGASILPNNPMENLLNVHAIYMELYFKIITRSIEYGKKIATFATALDENDRASSKKVSLSYC